MVNPNEELLRESEQILLACAVDFPVVEIGGHPHSLAKYVNEHSEIVEYFAYFLKEKVIWTRRTKHEVCQINDLETQRLRELLEFADTAPWLTDIASYRDRWNALEILYRLELIEFKLRDDIYQDSSRPNEREPIPVFQLQSDLTKFGFRVGDLLRDHARSPEKELEKRRNLLEDLGPAAPQVGGKNTARMFNPKRLPKKPIIRQAVYSGRTLLDYYDAEEGKYKSISHLQLLDDMKGAVEIRLLILTPRPESPYDEGADPNKLEANLLQGLMDLRNAPYDEHNPAPKLTLNPRSWLPWYQEFRRRTSQLNKLKIRFYGDSEGAGLFRGIIISGQEGIKAAQFAVWEIHEQRGTHGEYGQTTGNTSLALLLQRQFDEVFDNAVPVYKRHIPKWLFEQVKLEQWLAFGLLVIAAWALSIVWPNSPAKDRYGDAFFSILTVLAGLIPVAVSVIGRAWRLRPWSQTELRKFFPNRMAKFVAAVKAERVGFSEGYETQGAGQVVVIPASALPPASPQAAVLMDPNSAVIPPEQDATVSDDIR